MRSNNVKMTLIKITLSFAVLWCCMLRSRQVRNYQCFIPNKEPKLIWSFVADFSNVAKLNRRIKNWQLLSEEGNLHKWSYRVISYESMLGEFLFGQNENHGQITIETLVPFKRFSISENYKTLSFRKMLTIDNWAKMNFTKYKKSGKVGTLFEEEVTMECPFIFSLVCSVETDRNRKDFMQNLQNAFS